MKKGLKIGFGIVMGLWLGKVATSVAYVALARCLANDDSFMEKLKESDPEFYEKIKKYRTK